MDSLDRSFFMRTFHFLLRKNLSVQILWVWWGLTIEFYWVDIDWLGFDSHILWFNTIIGFHAELAEINAQKRYLSTQNKREILTIMWCLHSHYYCWILNIMLFTRISLQWATLGWQIQNCNGSLFNFVDMKVHSVKASLGEGEKKFARWAKLVI